MGKCPESPVSFWWWWAQGPLSCSGRYRGGSLAWESGDLVPVPDLSPLAQSQDGCPRCSELQPSATQAPRIPLWTAEPRPAAGAASRLQERKSEQGLGFSGQPTKPCWNLRGGARMDTALRFLLDFDGLLDSVGGGGSPPVPQASSSLPSMQSASASQRQRSGMQWPLLHWNWSMSQRGVQSFCGHGSRRPDQTWAPLRARPDSSKSHPPSVRSPCPPRRSHLHSHDPHRISSAQRCSGHWHRRTHSQSRAGGLGRDRERQAPGGWARGLSLRSVSSPCGALSPVPASLKATVDWDDDQEAQPIPGCPPGTSRAQSTLTLSRQGQIHERGHGVPGPALRTDCVWGGTGKDKTTQTAPGFRERPVKDGGLAQHGGRWALGHWQGCGRARARQKHLPLQPREDSVKMERNMR